MKSLLVPVLALTLITNSCTKSQSSPGFKDDYSFGINSKGEKNTSVTWFEIDKKKFYPVNKKSLGETILKDYTMAGKQAISLMHETFTFDESEKAIVSLTLNKHAFQKGKLLKSIKSFKEHKNKLVDLSVKYKSINFSHDLYDEFSDTYAIVKINKIESGIGYGEFEGKLYDTRTDKNSIKVKGFFKLKLK